MTFCVFDKKRAGAFRARERLIKVGGCCLFACLAGQSNTGFEGSSAAGNNANSLPAPRAIRPTHKHVRKSDKRRATARWYILPHLPALSIYAAAERGQRLQGRADQQHFGQALHRPRIEAGFECATAIKNSGAGAAMMRIEAVRRVFPRCCLDEKKTEAGRDALGYHLERKDENRMSVSVPKKIGRVIAQTRWGILRFRTRSRRRAMRAG